MEKIDFVLPWVDGSDKEWLAQKRKYESSVEILSKSNPEVNDDCRYRDYGLLKYWFRGVERFAPWVNRVFFVTCGQKPDWLDESNLKLRLVNHEEYIPSDYLPTFQSNTIELNLHRIPDLSEHFVLFNDATFLLRPVRSDFFFRKELPVIPCDLGFPTWLGWSHSSRLVINNCGILKRSLDVNRLVWKHFWKYADVGNLGFARATKNIVSFAVNRGFIPGTFGHLPASHLKSTLDEIWRKQNYIMDLATRNKFRNDNSVNQWLACAWNMVSGRFYPANEKKRGVSITIDSNSLSSICNTITMQLLPQLCISDRENTPDLDQCFSEVAKAFDKLLPEKSSFER